MVVFFVPDFVSGSKREVQIYLRTRSRHDISSTLGTFSVHRYHCTLYRLLYSSEFPHLPRYPRIHPKLTNKRANLIPRLSMRDLFYFQMALAHWRTLPTSPELLLMSWNSITFQVILLRVLIHNILGVFSIKDAVTAWNWTPSNCQLTFFIAYPSVVLIPVLQSQFEAFAQMYPELGCKGCSSCRVPQAAGGYMPLCSFESLYVKLIEHSCIVGAISYLFSTAVFKFNRYSV